MTKLNARMTEQDKSPRRFDRSRLARLRTQFELSDLLVFLYALVFVRQYFWFLDHNAVAWTLSVALAAAAWYLYVATKPIAAEKLGPSFWLVVGLPLLAAYFLRAALPDHAYDVLTYHLLHAERTLRGTLFGPGDYFPSPQPFNPVGDTMTGISRLFLGFRLGTAINLFVLLATAQIINKILRPIVDRPWLRAACVLLVILSEQLLFEISTYMVDLLALPLLLEALWLTLRANEIKNQRGNFARVALLLGAATAFKVTNLAMVLPLFAVCAYQLTFGARRLAPKQLPLTALLGAGAFLAPQVPFTIYIFRLTGNPIFPIANVFFDSPYWPTHGGWDYRWGPQNLWETLVWPVIAWFKPERVSELGLYSGRLSLAFVVAIVGGVFAWRNTRARTLCFIFISSALLWSVACTGYSRYGLSQEILAGITVLAIVAALTEKISWPNVSWPRISWPTISWRLAFASVLVLALAVQASFACFYTLKKDWGSRTSAFNFPHEYARDMTLILRDHELRSFLTDDERTLFDGVEVWFETAPKSTGFEVLLNPHAPIIAVRQPEYFMTGDARRQFINAVKQSSGKKMFSLCLKEDLARARQAIGERGLEVGTITPVDLPFFSPRDRISMMLIEVRIPDEAEARQRFESAWMKSAFRLSVYREQIVALDPPSVMHAGEQAQLRVKVKNLGSAAWPSVGDKNFRYQVNMGNHWIGGGARTDDNRAAMKADLPPGGEVELALTVNAPRSPGEYILEIDMVHEGVTWFKEKGARPLELHVRVQP
jgi:hypothetical protein